MYVDEIGWLVNDDDILKFTTRKETRGMISLSIMFRTRTCRIVSCHVKRCSHLLLVYWSVDCCSSSSITLLRPCSFNPLATGIGGDWRGLTRILTCKGFNPLQSLSNLSKPCLTEQGLRSF